MYTIKAYVDGKEYTIHDARVKALTVGGNPYFEIGDNINGSATFKVFPTHPYYDKVKKLTTDIVIYRDDEPEFYGRVLYDDEDFSGTKKVFVEGELAFLCDSIQRPKVYHNISVKAYVQDLIDIHNAQVEERKQFVVGRVTVKDSNDSLYRYSNYENTRTAFKDKLTSRLGGHLVSAAQITQTTFSGKSCAKIENNTSTYSLSWYQRPWAKKGKVTVRFKAACDTEDSGKARIRVTIDGKAFLTTAGELGSGWKQFEFTAEATPSYFHTYFYNYVADTTVYITDVEILGYISAYSESQLSVLKDSIEAEVKRATKGEEDLKASIKVNADNITSKVSKGDFGSYVTQYYDRVITAFNNSSKYVQISAGEIAIYDYGVSSSKKRAVFDESGNHFYRDGYYVGCIGTNQWAQNNSHKGWCSTWSHRESTWRSLRKPAHQPAHTRQCYVSAVRTLFTMSMA